MITLHLLLVWNFECSWEPLYLYMDAGGSLINLSFTMLQRMSL